MRSDHFHTTEIFEISHYLEVNTVYGRRFVLELVKLLFCMDMTMTSIHDVDTC